MALQLGHRFSVDLDLFSPAPDAVGPDERSVMRTAFDDPALAISWDKDMAFVGIWRGVGVSFFCLALYPLVQEPLLSEGVLSLAQVYDALSYYYEHQAEIEESIAQNREALWQGPQVTASS